MCVCKEDAKVWELLRRGSSGTTCLNTGLTKTEWFLVYVTCLVMKSLTVSGLLGE